MTPTPYTADPVCKSLPSLAAVAEIAHWAASAPATQRPAGWRVLEDGDGAVLLLPLGGTEPGFAIMPSEHEYDVLVCDPDASEEIGPFGSFDAALAGISWWLSLPRRWFELPDGMPSNRRHR